MNLVYEGTIYKFIEGTERNFIPRWLTIYDHCIATYKSSTFAVADVHKPLLALPKELIKLIKPYDPEKKMHISSKLGKEEQKLEE